MKTFTIFGKRINIDWSWGDIQVSKHKSFEYQIEIGKQAKAFCNSYFECNVIIRRKQDHAGIGFCFSILKLFWIDLNLYDHRHWDYDNGCWKKYE